KKYNKKPSSLPDDGFSRSIIGLQMLLFHHYRMSLRHLMSIHLYMYMTLFQSYVPADQVPRRRRKDTFLLVYSVVQSISCALRLLEVKLDFPIDIQEYF